MSVSSTNFFISFIGNGVGQAFAFPFYLYDKANLQVFVNGVLQAYTTNYTITGVVDKYNSYQVGGTVLFNAGQAPAGAAVVQLIRSTPKTQLFSFVDGGPFEADDFNHALDKLTLMGQESSVGQFQGTLAANPPGPNNIGDWYIVVPSVPGGAFGMVCVAAGNPGTFNQFGVISL